MQIQYIVQKYDKQVTDIIRLRFPDELVKDCNFVHKDRFTVDVANGKITITYDGNGKYKLAKYSNSFGLNINSNRFDAGSLYTLKNSEKKYLTGEVVGDKLVMDLNTLRMKPKGFNLFKPEQKSFKLAGK